MANLNPYESFNSLQTGKRITSEKEMVDWAVELWCFNSLQTGKRITRPPTIYAGRDLTFVSIPFKRESVSQDRISKECIVKRIAFQFPSNGKAYHKETLKECSLPASICFNSLQTGKRITSSSVRHARRFI